MGGCYSCKSSYESSGTSSSIPSGASSSKLSGAPSSKVSRAPSSKVSSAPSSKVSGAPSSKVSSAPSSEVSRASSSKVSSASSSKVSGAPSSKVSSAPSSIPSGAPSSIPSGAPSSKTSGVPSSKTSVPPSSKTSVPPSSKTSVPPSSKTSVPPPSKTSVPPSSKTSDVPSSKPISTPSWSLNAVSGSVNPNETFLSQAERTSFGSVLGICMEFEIGLHRGGFTGEFHDCIVISNAQYGCVTLELCLDETRTRIIPMCQKFQGALKDVTWMKTVECPFKDLAEKAMNIWRKMGSYNLIGSNCQDFCNIFLKRIGAPQYATTVETLLQLAAFALLELA